MAPDHPDRFRQSWPAWVAGWSVCVLLSLIFAIGCDSSSPKDAGSSASGESKPARIVSLSPAATQMLIDMGLEDRLVGVSQTDPAKDRGLVTCGTYNRPDTERLIALQPDLVITQPDAGRTPAKLQKYADNGMFNLLVMPHAHSIAEVSQALLDPSNGIGQAVGEPVAAADAERRMRSQLRAIEQVVADRVKPRVLLVINPAQLGVLGPQTTHEELLAIAGGTNAAGIFDSTYIQLSRAQVDAIARPDVILIIQSKGQPIVDGDTRLRAFAGLDIPAMQNRRVVVIDHPQASLPATSLAAVARQIAAALHPDLSDEIRAALEGAQP